ncbi:DUF421 domain-containing protein [Pontibacillus litoralis]|uniref:Membrane protein n=1 Tax=Pontibacillus litoralis JSM 072002 TaxID=1385512 RepID=A0A0A5HZJ4_9BACI|nr:DUF421 domain-containing protein [Pontibacillus litoralis]KGX88992.1 membrane protein [Pontibacillus litoralis JSM 072002]
MGANEIVIIVTRTFATYFIILLIFRLMGKREIGELSIIDLVVFVMLAEIGVFSIEEPQDEFMHAVIPMVLLLFIQRGTAWISLKSRTFRTLVDGRPSVIIKKGNIDEEEMRKQRYNFDDLMMQLREQGVRSIGDVDFAILEPSGKLSVYEKKDDTDSQAYILPLIIDGEIQLENLRYNDKEEEWLKAELHRRGYHCIENISFLTIDQHNEWYIDEFDKEKEE